MDAWLLLVQGLSFPFSGKVCLVAHIQPFFRPVDAEIKGLGPPDYICCQVTQFRVSLLLLDSLYLLWDYSATLKTGSSNYLPIHPYAGYHIGHTKDSSEMLIDTKNIMLSMQVIWHVICHTVFLDMCVCVHHV